MRIRGARVSHSVPHRAELLTKFGLLREAVDTKKPAIFFGCYTDGDRSRILAHRKHKQLAVLVWRGTDATRLHQEANKPIRQMRNLRHIAISSFIARDLEEVNRPYIRLPITSVDPRSVTFRPVPLGSSIYVYGIESASEVYGKSRMSEVMQQLPGIHFFCGDSVSSPEPYTPRVFTFSRDSIHEVYKKCFIGLRLTEHDGLSNTVLELGLMGRKCIWNGDAPNAIPWTDVDSIVDAIREEQVCIGDTHRGLAKKVRQYLDIGDSWLHTEFYGRDGAGWKEIQVCSKRMASGV